MTNPLKIYSGSNALLYTTPINTGCRRRVQLMNEDSITVKFSDKTKMKFPVGTRIGDFYITKEQQEKYNATTGGYDYELKFDAYYWLWANRLLFYVMPGVTNAPKETSFKLTATIDVHAAVILRCLNALGFKYNDSPFRVDTDEGFSTEAKYISYANMSVLGGIQAIADAYECEWWVVGNSIHFGKCNAIGEYDFTVGENVASITSDAKTTPANRLVVFGSTRNLPPNYRTPESSDVVDAVVVKRLMLPEGTPYLQTSPDIPEDEIVEEEVVLDSVYPRTSLTVTDVETYDSTNDGMTQTFYRIKYGTAFHFSKDYILPDEELHVVFESGDLNGMDFAVKFNPLGLAEKKDDGSFNPEAQMFEIVANEDYGRSLPDAVLHPSKTDRFSLYGWDSTKMEALGLLAAAEQELLTEGNKLLDEYRKDKQTYTCPMMWDWCKEQAEEGNSPRLGSVVNLHFVAGDTGRKSRIIGYEHDLDIEYSNVTYICGEKVSVSRLKTLESKVEGLTHDGTKVKVQNSLDFLSKRYSDRTPYQLASDMGFDVGQFLASVSGGRFGIDKVTGQSFLEVDRIFARVRAYFESLTVVERESLAGEQMVTPGGGVKCTSVEEVRNAQNVLTGWRCYFLSEQDGEKRETKIIVGDQAIAQTFNAKAGTTNKVSNHRWWRLVTGVSNNAYTDDSGNIYGYIEVSKSDCETDSDTPKEGDDVIQFGNRTDKTRQAAILISTVATDAPSIKLLTGIDHYSLVGKDIISQGYDAAKGHAYFRCYGDTYIGAPDGSTYVKYDVDSKKLTVKADLEVGSTIGGKDAEDFVKDLIPEIPELTQEDIEDFVNNIVDPKIEGIQDQIDGVVESFFGFGAPTLSNYPANEWTTDELRKAHERDTYTDKTEYVDDVTTPTAGMSWKWQYTSPTDYGWVKIADSDATRALLDAARAQDTADGKRRTFTAQPVPPYDKGDIWVNATYPAGNTVKDAASGKYHNDILRCNTSRATGSFAIGDWGLASNYTDDTAALAAAAAAQAAKNAADAAQSAANAAQSSVTSLNDYVNGAFKDGIIDETEASGIANYINIVNADKERIDGTYQTLYANAYLSATGKAALKTAHDDVAAKITALISAINSAIADNKVTAAESAAVNSAFSAFSTSNKAFSAAVETANEEIQQTLKSAADAAKTAADNAKAAADAAKGVADAAKDRLDQWAADGVISPTEKQAIKDEIARIDADKAHIAAEYTRYSLGTPTDYNTAHSAYRAQLVALSASTPENIIIPPYFSANQTSYYNQRTAALSAIATAAKKYADDVAKEEAKKATDVYKYLKESLLNAQQESTEISGGLILSTMMALGYTENGVKKILSGMNGSYVSSLGGRTIASWYGGHMLDLFDKNDNRIANPTGQEATSLIRMDGSFYFANGNIGGRTDGSGWLAGNNITWDASGAITFGNGIHIDLGSGNSTTLGGLNSKLSGVETTVGSVLTLVNALSNVLVPVNSSGTRVAWNSADLFAVKSVKGFYSEEFVSARGMNGQSSSISKYLTDLLDVGISAPASGQALVYNGSKWVNQAVGGGLDETALASYLTTNNYAKKSDIPSLTPYLKVDGSNGTAAGLTAMINKLSPGDANITDSTMLVTSHATTPDGNNYYRRSATYLWGYIKGKADSVYATSGHTHNVMINGETKTISATGAPAVNLGTFLTAHQSLANYVTLNTAQTISALKTITAGLKVSGRVVGSGDDEGIVISPSANGYAGLCLGNNAGKRSVFYFIDTNSTLKAFWRFYNGSTNFDIAHPAKSGTIALTSDIPSLSGYATQTWVNSNSYLTTGSAASTYVKKTGDTMTGLLTINMPSSSAVSLSLNTANTAEVGLRLNMSNVSKGWVGYHPTYGTNLYNYKCAKYLALNDAGVPNLSGSTIWHAGNDGSGSGLDADLLDGLHSWSFNRTFGAFNCSVTGSSANITTAQFIDKLKAAGMFAFRASNTKTTWAYAYNDIITDSGCGNIGLAGAVIEFFGNESEYTVRVTTSPAGNYVANAVFIYRNHGSNYNPNWKRLANTTDTVANANSLGDKAASQYVTTDTAQTITAQKVFKISSTIFRSDTRGVILYSDLRGKAGAIEILGANGAWTSSCIEFENNGNLTATKSITAASFIRKDGTSFQFLKADGSVDSNSYLTTGSAASTYVKKTGDTMTGLLTINMPSSSAVSLSLNTANTAEVGLRLNMSNVSKGWVGYHPTYGTNLYNYKCAKYLALNDAGVPNLSGSTIWHAGNDGSGSGLDADLLDGLHLADIRAYGYAMQDTWIDASSLNADTWYPVTMYLSANNNTRIEVLVALDSGTKPAWSTHTKGFSVRLIWESQGNGWGVNEGIVRRVYESSSAWANDVIPVRSIGQLTNSSTEYVFVRGGGKYRFRTSHGVIPTLRTSTYTISSQSVSPTTTTPAVSNRNVAFISDNVASATKLQTARTIWGQSFNGTGNVSGNISGCPRIYNAASNNLYLGNSDNSGWVLTQDICSHSGAGDTYWSLRSNGNFHCKTALVGTTTNSYVLNTASFICDSWVRTKGATGWYSETYCGGWYMTDSTWIRNYNNKALYMNTAIIRTDGTIQVGSDGSKFYANSSGVVFASAGIWSNGYVSARGQNTSDIRLKEDIKDFRATDIIKALRPVQFKWNATARSKFPVLDTDTPQYGLIAQEAEKTAPWLVDRKMFDDGYWGVRYDKLIPVLLKGQQETIRGLMQIDNSLLLVTRKTETLEQRVTRLEAENRELKTQISQLKTQLA